MCLLKNLQHLQLNSHRELYWKEVCSYPKQKEADEIKYLKSRNQFALAPLWLGLLYSTKCLQSFPFIFLHFISTLLYKFPSPSSSNHPVRTRLLPLTIFAHFERSPYRMCPNVSLDKPDKFLTIRLPRSFGVPGTFFPSRHSTPLSVLKYCVLDTPFCCSSSNFSQEVRPRLVYDHCWRHQQDCRYVVLTIQQTAYAYCFLCACFLLFCTLCWFMTEKPLFHKENVPPV